MKTRRDFIKISAAGAGVAALGLSPLSWDGVNKLSASNNQRPVSDDEMTPYPTYCEVCFWKCAGWTYVDKKGEIKKNFKKYKNVMKKKKINNIKTILFIYHLTDYLFLEIFVYHIYRSFYIF